MRENEWLLHTNENHGEWINEIIHHHHHQNRPFHCWAYFYPTFSTSVFHVRTLNKCSNFTSPAGCLSAVIPIMKELRLWFSICCDFYVLSDLIKLISCSQSSIELFNLCLPPDPWCSRPIYVISCNFLLINFWSPINFLMQLTFDASDFRTECLDKQNISYSFLLRQSISLLFMVLPYSQYSPIPFLFPLIYFHGD